MNAETKSKCKQCGKEFYGYEMLASHFASSHPWLFLDILEWIDNTTLVEYNEL